MNENDVLFWNLIYTAEPYDSDALIETLRWRGSRAYLVVSIAGYNRIMSIGKAIARSILRDKANVRGLEHEGDIYLITDGVDTPPYP